MNDFSIIFGYFLFLFLLATIVGYGAPEILDNAVTAPNYFIFDSSNTTWEQECSYNCTDDFIAGATCKISERLCGYEVIARAFAHAIWYVFATLEYMFVVVFVSSAKYPLLGVFLTAGGLVTIYTVIKVIRGD